jgi:hypothetical protein
MHSSSEKLRRKKDIFFCQYEKFRQIAESKSVMFTARPDYCILINIKCGLVIVPCSSAGIATAYFLGGMEFGSPWV